jgi:hypothetical protein
MKHLVPAVVLLVFLQAHAFATSVPAMGTVDVYFPPRGGATQAITSEIAKARTEVLVQGRPDLHHRHHH